MSMFNDLPCPFMVDDIKIWPVHSRPEYQWFIAHLGEPFYFRSRAEAVAFAKKMQVVNQDIPDVELS